MNLRSRAGRRRRVKFAQSGKDRGMYASKGGRLVVMVVLSRNRPTSLRSSRCGSRWHTPAPGTGGEWCHAIIMNSGPDSVVEHRQAADEGQLGALDRPVTASSRTRSGSVS